MAQVLHWSATTTEAIRRAIQNSRVCKASTDHEFLSSIGTVAGEIMSPACYCGAVTAGPDGVR